MTTGPLRTQDASLTSTITVTALADTGCQSCLAGSNLLRQLGLTKSDLLPVKTKMRAASNDGINLLGAILLKISGPDAFGRLLITNQMTYISDCTDNFFLCKEACADLGLISSKFPTIGDNLHIKETKSASIEKTNPETKAPCGCPKRSAPPPPPKPPVFASSNNRLRLQEFLLRYYSSSTFNTCTHQPLPAMSGPPMHLMVDQDAIPVAYHTPYPTPLHFQDQVKAGLDKDVRLGVLEPVPSGTPTTWCHRMVVCAKKDGTPRRTVDFQSLNKYARRETHHTQSPFHLARSVPHNVKKTTCDAWNGYHGVPITEASQHLTTFITLWGRYRYKVAPQGYITSGDGYTKRFDAITADFRDVVRCIDDSLLWAANTEQCFYKTVEYLELCGRNGIILNPDKFIFAADQVEFAGFEVTMTNVQPCDRFIRGILDFPTPKSITDIRSWFGLVNQASYAFSMADSMLPFRSLLQPGIKFDWTQTLDNAFHNSKLAIAKEIEKGVCIFDKFKPTCLATDWSKSGIGFWLFQKHCACPGNKLFCCKVGWKTTLVGSRFTHAAESRYAPVEGEALAVVHALDKARYFVLGCSNLTVAVDHKPLLKLFGDRCLEDIPNPRLRNLKEKTLRYRFKMVHISGVKHKVADGLSRHPVDPAEAPNLPDDVAALTELTTHPDLWKDDNSCVEDAVSSMVQSSFRTSPISSTTWDLVRSATASDIPLNNLLSLIENGFPDSNLTLPDGLKPYFHLRHDLCSVDGVILYGDRIVIPPSLRPNVLSTLHAAHQGVDKMLSRAEYSVFWPGITNDIRSLRERCADCNRNAPSNPCAPPTPPIPPDYPFQCVCADFFSLGGTSYLVIVDRYSNWPTVCKASGGSAGLIASLKLTFTTFGIPEELASDGGPEFTASATSDFLRNWGVHHRLSSVAFAHSNCRAEVAVKSMKRLLAGKTGPTGTLNSDAFLRALLQYRNTPDRDTKLSPAMCIFGRQIRDFVPVLPSKYKPHTSWQETLQAREKALQTRHAKIHERLSLHTRRLPPLRVGDHVRIQNQTGRFPLKWDKTGVVVEVRQFDQYIIRIDGSNYSTVRNRKFLRKFVPLYTTPPPKPISDDINYFNGHPHQIPAPSSSTPVHPETPLNLPADLSASPPDVTNIPNPSPEETSIPIPTCGPPAPSPPKPSAPDPVPAPRKSHQVHRTPAYLDDYVTTVWDYH